MNPLAIAGGALGLFGLIGKGISRAKSNKELKAQMKLDPVRQESAEVNSQYAMAQQMLNAPDVYEQEAQRAAVTRFGNTGANIAKGATDASQFLAANAAATGQLAQDQAEATAGGVDTYYKNLEFMQQATQAKQAENQAQFGDQVRRFEGKTAALGAIAQNRANTWGDVANFGQSLASLGIGAQGAGLNIFGKKKGGNG